jgi:hypothetical protein
MKTTHTPKPWTIDGNSRFGESRICAPYKPGVTYLVALVSPDCPDDATRDANARLIIAAPDLLAACEALHAEILAYLTAQNLHGEHNPAMVAARAAIAKAKGES